MGTEHATDAVESFEIERKYAVPADAALPLAAFESQSRFRIGDRATVALEARYFDTPQGALAAQGLAVRRRDGGKDEGWHLKERRVDGVLELQWPLAPDPPDALLREIRDRLGSRFTAMRIAPIATIRTKRTTVLLRDPSGEDVVELADDRVRATNEVSGAEGEWREWEAELIAGADPSLLDLVEPLLLAAGGALVSGSSKIQRTMQL